MANETAPDSRVSAEEADPVKARHEMLAEQSTDALIDHLSKNQAAEFVDGLHTSRADVVKGVAYAWVSGVVSEIPPDERTDRLAIWSARLASRQEAKIEEIVASNKDIDLYTPEDLEEFRDSVRWYYPDVQVLRGISDALQFTISEHVGTPFAEERRSIKQ